MRAADTPDFKLFWLMILLGVVCAGFGGAIAWLSHASTRLDEERAGWVKAEAQLYEVGIRWSNARRGADYEMTARYILHVDGREYAGSDIGNGAFSTSAVEVRALILPFAPEAAEFNLEDLGRLNPQRSWHVVYRPVRARYDPRDPARSQILLDQPIVIETAAGWFIRGIMGCFLLAAAMLWILAWPSARRRQREKNASALPAGPAPLGSRSDTQ